MAFGDGIRRNIAHVDPEERAALRDGFIALNRHFFPGSRTDVPSRGGVSWWFKQDEIHRWANHVHGAGDTGMLVRQPLFLPWHRVIVNELEALLRQVDPRLSLHYWDWTQDPRAIPDANLGRDGLGQDVRGPLNLFTEGLMGFMGYGGGGEGEIGDPWRSAGFYVPDAANFRTDDPDDPANHNPADPPRQVVRSVGNDIPLATTAGDEDILIQDDYLQMRLRMEAVHNRMHGFVNMGSAHRSFRDPFVFLLHSNVDRLFARWQTDPTRSGRLTRDGIYGSESGAAALHDPVEPWSGPSVRHSAIRPWAPPDDEGDMETYRDYKTTAVITPPCYDTNHRVVRVVEVENPVDMRSGRHQIRFNDVPEDETTWRAALFRIFTCGEVTFTLTPGVPEPAPPFRIATRTVRVPHGPNAYVEARVWFQFTAGPRGSATQTPRAEASIRCEQEGQPPQDFQFDLSAVTIQRPTVAVQMALDQSGSMAFAAGTSGATRLQVLQDAAYLFVSLIQPGNGVGIIRFDDEAYPSNHARFGGLAMTKIIDPEFADAGRIEAARVIDAHGAHGQTSVGDGLIMARQELPPVSSRDYTKQAILILTDGRENRPVLIADVPPIDVPTYAVGLGNEFQVNTRALTMLAGSTGGSLLLSGLLSRSLDDQFRLRKFFLQILAGITRTSIVRDPVGWVTSGTRIRIPFDLNEADIDCRVILLANAPLVKLSLETPGGEIIDEAGAAGTTVRFDATRDFETAEFTLPAVIRGGKAQTGTWHALLEIDPGFRHPDTHADRSLDDPRGAEYCLCIHAYSNLRMEARADQDGFAPGATIHLRAKLTEYGVPVEGRAAVRAKLDYPDGTAGTVTFSEAGPGLFEASVPTSLAGIYRFLVVAEGVTFRGSAFSREQLLTAAVFHEIADQPAGDGEPGSLAEVAARCCQRMAILGGVTILLLLVILWALLRG